MQQAFYNTICCILDPYFKMMITRKPNMVSKYFNLFHTVEISVVLFICMTLLSKNFEKLLKMQQIRGIDHCPSQRRKNTRNEVFNTNSLVF